MSSLRRINSSRANAARSPGPITPEGKERASTNALRHGLLAKCVVLQNESNQCFDHLVTQHIQRFAPADGVEFAMIEEMVAANWRQRRAWAIENRLMEKAICNQPPGDEAERIANAFSQLAASPASTSALSATSSCLANLNYQTNPVPFPNSAPRWRRVPAVDVPEHVDLPTPSASPAGAAASPQIASSLGNHALPNEPNPIFEHQPPGPWPPAPGPRPPAPGPWPPVQ